jgi:hypothetical protein
MRMTDHTTYVLGDSKPELDRLAKQATFYEAATVALMDQIASGHLELPADEASGR